MQVETAAFGQHSRIGDGQGSANPRVVLSARYTGGSLNLELEEGAGFQASGPRPDARHLMPEAD